MASNQSMIFGMPGRIRVMRGFGQERVDQLPLVCGLVKPLPEVLATLLQAQTPVFDIAHKASQVVLRLPMLDTSEQIRS